MRAKSAHCTLFEDQGYTRNLQFGGFSVWHPACGNALRPIDRWRVWVDEKQTKANEPLSTRRKNMAWDVLNQILEFARVRKLFSVHRSALRHLEVGGVEAVGEPTVDLNEHRASVAPDQ